MLDFNVCAQKCFTSRRITSGVFLQLHGRHARARRDDTRSSKWSWQRSAVLGVLIDKVPIHTRLPCRSRHPSQPCFRATVQRYLSGVIVALRSSWRKICRLSMRLREPTLTHKRQSDRSRPSNHKRPKTISLLNSRSKQMRVRHCLINSTHVPNRSDPYDNLYTHV
jgi:hypothetical protein